MTGVAAGVTAAGAAADLTVTGAAARVTGVAAVVTGVLVVRVSSAAETFTGAVPALVAAAWLVVKSETVFPAAGGTVFAVLLPVAGWEARAPDDDCLVETCRAGINLETTADGGVGVLYVWSTGGVTGFG